MEIVYEYSKEKSALLKEERGISFEEVIAVIREGRVLDVIDNPSKTKYGHQKMYVVEIDHYIYLVPFVETTTGVFLKTIFPSRKLTKIYLNRE